MGGVALEECPDHFFRPEGAALMDMVRHSQQFARQGAEPLRLGTGGRCGSGMSLRCQKLSLRVPACDQGRIVSGRPLIGCQGGKIVPRLAP